MNTVTAVLIFALASAITVARANSDNCPVACPAIFAPVCAISKLLGGEKTFSNECELHVKQCKYPSAAWEFLRNDECGSGKATECIKPCPKILMPVCAVSKLLGQEKTFSNACMLENMQCSYPEAAWKLIKDGEYDTEKKCSTVCTQIYEPVCASSKLLGLEKTFSNQCELEAEQCKNPAAGWEVKTRGECSPKKNTCSTACPDIYAPVCAISKTTGEQKTYPSKCDLEAEQCMNPVAAWQLVKNGECTKPRDCPQMCPAIYKPVCATSRLLGLEKTFSNVCELSVIKCNNPVAAWELVHDGECEGVFTTECKKYCPKIYMPVCAVSKFLGEEKTFNNLCEFEVNQCTNPKAAWQLVRTGTCETECKKACPKIYKPVCGSSIFLGVEKTFSNMCEFQATQCTNPLAAWQLVKEGRCINEEFKTCPLICPAIYEPVCASSVLLGLEKTISNTCLLRVKQCLNPTAAWTLVKTGECIKPSSNCPRICPANYDPICASSKLLREEKTFSNECELKAFQCRNPTSAWKFVKAGEC